MYKNQLQVLAQKSCFNLPSYTCIREGPAHASRFKAVVNFNGESFESPSFCSTIRQAEHAAAEVAFNSLSSRGSSHSLAARTEIEKDGEIERLSTEVKELQKSKKQVVELVGAKDAEISEKNATLKRYFNLITSLTDGASHRKSRLRELKAEMVRCKAHCDKLLQEKELIEKQNTWLNDELTMKVDTLLEQRRKAADMEAEYSMKLADLEKQYNECSSSLSKHKERVRELESKTECLHRELCSARDDGSAAEQRYSTEILTVSKLANLYKESSEEWSKNSGELEGVIKARAVNLVIKLII